MITKLINLSLLACVMCTHYTQAESDLTSKPASKFTVQKNQQLLQTLPFNDKTDFALASKGLIAKPQNKHILNANGEVIWDFNQFDFLKEHDFIPSINPSLHRQALLNLNYGLFKVSEHIYQVRGFDLANVTYVKGDTGWIIFDPLTVPETAKAAHDLITKHLGDRPIKAIVYSHAHADHFGGVKGIISQQQVDNNDVQVIAPAHFMEHVVKESVLAGNAMQRRAGYQYGSIIGKNELSTVDSALGKGIAFGYVSLIAPTRIIEQPQETIVVDGIEMVMKNTPNTESPSEMNTWFPQFKTLWMAENTVAGMHNIYTIRGAETRDASQWSKKINQTLQQFGKQADILIASHHWPRWGNKNIVHYLEKQRDMYGYMHDQALNLANQGVTINEIHNQFTVPESLSNEWFNRGYHGSVSHNVRGIINKYLGFFDMNPATLNKLSPADSAKRYVKLAGGSKAMLNEAQTAFNNGEYRWVAELLNHLVYAEPENQAAIALQADTLEQLGYQAENAGWRNAYLSAAYELRNGMPSSVNKTEIGPDIIKAMSTELVFDYLGVRLNAEKAAQHQFIINIQLPDTQEQFVIELNNAHLNNLANTQSEHADLTLTLNRADLDLLLMKQADFKRLLESNKASFKGDIQKFALLISLIDNFDYWFEIVKP